MGLMDRLRGRKKDQPIISEAFGESSAPQVYHCPFCGSSSVTGGSDGTIECGYCESNYTVFTRPKHPGMPLSVDGQPYEVDGQPIRSEEPVPAGNTPESPLPSEPDSAAGGLESYRTDVTDPSGAPAATTSIEQYRTAAGAKLSRADYVKHLAITNADDRDAVIEQVRADVRR